MSITRGAVIATLLVVASIGSAAAAPSTSDKQRAAQSFQIGKAAYARGEFRDAAAAFEQAAFYAPHPATLLNAAESWELADNPSRAAQLCDRVLDTPMIEVQHREVAQRQLAKLEKKIGTIVVKAPAKARIDLDEHEESTTKLRVAPGSHKVKVTGADGESQTQTIAVGAGETKEVDLLEARAPAKPVERDVAPPSPSGPPLGTWVAFGFSAVAGGAAAYFGVKTLDAQSAFDARPTVTSRDDFNNAKLSTNIALGLAVSAAAIGVVLWVVSTPPPRPTKGGLVLSTSGALLW